MKLQLATLAALVPAVYASLDDFLSHVLHGDDYNFTVTFPAGEKLSTKDKPITKATKQTVLRDSVVLASGDPEIKMEGLTDADKKKRYIALCVTWSLPTLEGVLDDAYIAVPWYGLDLSVSDDGTLSTKDRNANTGGRFDLDDSYGEVRNATFQVWEQTEDFVTLLALKDDIALAKDSASGIKWPAWFNLAQVWNGLSSKVDYDFKVGEVEFKWQRVGGDKRCDVDEMGAPIEAVKVGDTKSCKHGYGPWADGAEEEKDDEDEKSDDKKGSDKDEDDEKSEKSEEDDSKDDKKDNEDDKDSAAAWLLSSSMSGILAVVAAAALYH